MWQVRGESERTPNLKAGVAALSTFYNFISRIDLPGRED